MTLMYETLKRIYKKSKNAELIKKAVEKGWINEEQFQEITGTKFDA